MAPVMTKSVIDGVEFLGRLAAEQDIAEAEAHTTYAREEAKRRAKMYREEQSNILAPLDVNRQVAQSIIAEMEDCLHVGMDELGTWHREFSDTVLPNAPTADPYRTAADLWKGWRR